MKSLIRSIIRKGSLVLIFYMLFYSTHVKAQDSTNTKFNGKKIVAIGIGEIGYSITYTSFYKKQRAFEITVGYREGVKVNQLFLFTLNNPPWCYNQYTLIGGLRFYNSEGLYFSPVIVTSYGFYNNLEFSEYDGRKNYYPLISRGKKGVGGIAKFGFSPINKRFVMNIYLGLGYKISYINEKIVDPDAHPVSTNYSTYWKIEPTVHVGLLVGIILNKKSN